MVCRRCAKDNPAENRFCARCGLELTEPEPRQGDYAEQKFCYKHTREPTNLSCGRCDRPICTRCLVMSPAGVRCRDCSRHNVAVRPAAVLHEASVGVRSLFRMGPWSIWIIIALIGLAGTIIRSCSQPSFPPPDAYPPENTPVPSPPVPTKGA